MTSQIGRQLNRSGDYGFIDRAINDDVTNRETVKRVRRLWVYRSGDLRLYISSSVAVASASFDRCVRKGWYALLRSRKDLTVR